MRRPRHHGPVISARTLALLADTARLRRLRVAYRADPEVYGDLLTIAAVTLAYGSGSPVLGTELAVDAPPAVGSVMSTAAAAQVLGITDAGVRKAIRRGRLAARHHDGRWWITTDAVARYRAA